MSISDRLAKFAQFLVAKDWDGGETPPGDVGLAGIASKEEAEAGAAEDKAMTPLRTAQAIAALSPPLLGVDQVWQETKDARSANTQYQNTTGRTLAVAIQLEVDDQHDPSLVTLQVSANGTNWSTIGVSDNTSGVFAFGLVPPGHYYKAETIYGTAVFWNWVELKEAS